VVGVRPNKQMQPTGRTVPGSARVLIADGGQRNVKLCGRGLEGLQLICKPFYESGCLGRAPASLYAEGFGPRRSALIAWETSHELGIAEQSASASFSLLEAIQWKRQFVRARPRSPAADLQVVRRAGNEHP
jgi:hypothetical protein